MAPSIPPDGKIPCPTPHQLRAELEDFAYVLAPEEKEDTWEKFEKAVVRFSAVVRGGGYKHIDVFVEGLGRGGIGAKLVKCMLSDRGRLSGATTELLQTFAPRLGQAFKPLVHLYLEPLVELLGRPNRVFLKRSEKCLATIISHCHLPTIVPELRRGLDDNSAQCRKGCAVGLEKAMKEWPAEVWAEKWLVVLESGMKKMATDKDPEVRKVGKRVWALFNDFWPERVEEFTGPLTPTIRRYLDIPAVNGAGPSRPKPARAAGPPARPVPTSSSISDPAHKPQNTRVQALALRSHSAAPPHAPTPVESDPSRRVSPRRAPEPAYREEPVYPSVETYRPERANRAFDALPSVLGRHARSASQNTVPSASNPLHNPLSKPVRPALPSSFSTTALFTEEYGGFKPQRRLAPPERIVRSRPLEEEGGGEEHEGGMGGGGGGWLRGAVRPLLGGRRAQAMGQAQRRAMTAPMPVSTGLDGGALKRELKVPTWREDNERDEESAKAVKEKGQGQALPSPPSSRSQSFFSPLAAAPKSIGVDSPLMPVLVRSSSGDVKADHRAGDVDGDEPVEVGGQEASDGMINLKEMYPASPGPMDERDMEKERKIAEIAAAVELPGSPVQEAKEQKEQEEEEAAEEAVIVDPEDKGVDRSAEVGQVAVPAKTGEVDAAVEEDLAQEEVTKTEPEMIAPQALAVEQSVFTIPPTITLASAAQAPLRATSTASTCTDKPPHLNPAPRNPSVPTARSAAGAARSVSGRTVPSAPVVRKTFKPTSLTAPTAASAARAAAVNASKPVPAPAGVRKPSGATSTVRKPGVVAVSSKAAMAKSTSKVDDPSCTTKPSDNATGALKLEAKTFAKPALPGNPKPAAARVASGTKNPAASEIALPPAKKERIRLKAPLPSFRPQRAAPLNAPASGSTSLNTLVSSATSGRSRMRPETVKLPDSPVKVSPAEVPLPLSPHDEPFPPSLRCKAVSISSVHRGSPLRPERTSSRTEAQAKRGSPVATHSPLTVAPARPVSPLLTTSDAETARLPPPPLVFALRTEKAGAEAPREQHREGKAGAQASLEDDFGSVSGKAGSSSATTRVIMLEDSEEDEMEGMTFKAREGVQASPPKVAQVDVEEEATQITESTPAPAPTSSPPTQLRIRHSPVNAFAPRSDVSTPQKSAAMLLAKLDGGVLAVPSTMERRALAVKDANTASTPRRFDGDVST